MNSDTATIDPSINKDVDLSFIPSHIVEKVGNKVVLKRYGNILKRGGFEPIHYKCLSETMKSNPLYRSTKNDAGTSTGPELESTTTKLFKDVVRLRRFDDYGNALRSNKIPHSGDQVVVRKLSNLMHKEICFSESES